MKSKCKIQVQNSKSALIREVFDFWPERAPPRQSGIGGVKGRNINEISFPGSPALWAGSFTFNNLELI